MNEVKIEEKAHCANGPSTLPARAICPVHEGSGGGEIAESGTRAHLVVECDLKCEAEPQEVNGVAVTSDEKNRGHWGAKKIRELAEGAEIHSESRVDFHNATGEPSPLDGIFGTCDAWWYDEINDVLHVADFKTYAKGDSAKDYGPQLMAYAVMIESRQFPPIEKAVGHVVAAGDYTTTTYEFDIAEAKRTVEAILERIGTATIADAKPCDWCSTCAKRETCPAMSRAVEAVADKAIEAKPLAFQMALVPAIEAWAKWVKARVREELDAGRPVRAEKKLDDGREIVVEFALATKKANAVLVDLKGLAGAVIEAGVNPATFAGAVKISKTAVDKLLKDADEQSGNGRKAKERAAIYEPYFKTPDAPNVYVKRIS